jgi:hypothetical protein
LSPFLNAGCQVVLSLPADKSDAVHVMETLLAFLTAIETDPRICSGHISLYLALWRKWQAGSSDAVCFFRQELAASCKISSPTTFFKLLHELQAYGYLRYVPSYTPLARSRVYFDVR